MSRYDLEAAPAAEGMSTLYESLSSASNQVERAEGLLDEIEARLRGHHPKVAQPERNNAAEAPAPYIGIHRHAAGLYAPLDALNQRLESILKGL